MSQPVVYTGLPRNRPFATTPIALQAIIMNEDEQFLLLNSPKRQQGWQTISGAMEARQTILAGTLREVGEEVGVRVRPFSFTCQTVAPHPTSSTMPADENAAPNSYPLPQPP